MADYLDAIKGKDNEAIIAGWIKANPGMTREQAVREHLTAMRQAGSRQSAGEFASDLGIRGTMGQAYQNVRSLLGAIPRAAGYDPARSQQAVERTTPGTLPGAAGMAIAPGVSGAAAGLAPIGTGIQGLLARAAMQAGAGAGVGAATGAATGDPIGKSMLTAAGEGMAQRAIEGIGRFASSVDLFGNVPRIANAIADRVGRTLDTLVPAWKGLVKNSESLMRLRDPEVGRAALDAMYGNVKGAARQLDEAAARLPRSMETVPVTTPGEGSSLVRQPVSRAPVDDLFTRYFDAQDSLRAAQRQIKLGGASNVEGVREAQAAVQSASGALRDRLQALSPDLARTFDQTGEQYAKAVAFLEALKTSNVGAKGQFVPNTLANAIVGMSERGGQGKLNPVLDTLGAGNPMARQQMQTFSGPRLYGGGGHILFGEGEGGIARGAGLSEHLPSLGIMRTPGGNPTVVPGRGVAARGLAPLIESLSAPEQAGP